MISQVNPSRMELINLKRRIVVAERGHELLKKKRDALVMEFFKHLEKVTDLRKDLNAMIVEAHKALLKAEAVDGRIKVKSTSLAVKNQVELAVSERNIMGVPVPDISAGKLTSAVRAYGLLGTSVRIDMAAKKFQDSLLKLVELAKFETVLKRLLDEIAKTRRRVNALEYVLIPGLEQQKSYVSMVLDEQERESFFKLKRMKD
jgi:V/A-type H+-transporting ATPase subunit D